MVMKLLGLSCGRKMGNSEILLKEALMGAEELGRDAEILRMQDLDIRPCKLCSMACPWTLKGPEACAIKDDAPFLLDKVMECDGLIISAPVYTLTPPGYLKMIGDRALGPKGDVAFKLERKKMQGTAAYIDDGAIDERAFKNRAGGFICVGGAPHPDWVSLGLPLLHTMTFSLQIAIVDQLQVLGAAEIGSVVLDEEAIKRARRLGRNVAEAMGKPFDEVKYKGDEPGTCPICHTNLMVVGKESPIECAICGIKGDIKVDGNKITVVFPEEQQKRSRLAIEGKRIHYYEIRDVAQAFAPRKGDVRAKLAKYKSYKSPIKPPSKVRKGTRA
jgi:multimeric flavodoxin WrbA